MYNFKNPAKTLIRVAQCSQATKWGSGKVKIQNNEVLSAKMIKVSETLSKNNLHGLGLQENDIVQSAKSIKVNGVEFRRGLFVLLEKASLRDDNLHIFGKINEILVMNDGKIYFLTSVCKTSHFDTSLIAWAIELDNELDRFTEVNCLAYFKPVYYWTKPKDDLLYISLRHIIV